MYPEDRVLVGVINRQRDFDKAQYEHWYRVPHGKAPQGIHAEYIAFFFSRAFKAMNGGIHYYARRTGVELARRRDLLSAEANHPRADDLYHKLQLGELRRREPPILNTDRRVVTFIHTTWDRFSQAETLADLYSDADQFVDRVFYALERSGVRSERVWEAEHAGDGAAIRVLCEDGTVHASTLPRDEYTIPLTVSSSHEAVQVSVAAILEAIRQHGGPSMLDLPLEQ